MASLIHLPPPSSSTLLLTFFLSFPIPNFFHLLCLLTKQPHLSRVLSSLSPSLTFYSVSFTHALSSICFLSSHYHFHYTSPSFIHSSPVPSYFPTFLIFPYFTFSSAALTTPTSFRPFPLLPPLSYFLSFYSVGFPLSLTHSLAFHHLRLLSYSVTLQPLFYISLLHLLYIFFLRYSLFLSSFLPCFQSLSHALMSVFPLSRIPSLCIMSSVLLLSLIIYFLQYYYLPFCFLPCYQSFLPFPFSIFLLHIHFTSQPSHSPFTSYVLHKSFPYCFPPYCHSLTLAHLPSYSLHHHIPSLYIPILFLLSPTTPSYRTAFLYLAAPLTCLPCFSLLPYPNAISHLTVTLVLPFLNLPSPSRSLRLTFPSLLTYCFVSRRLE